MIETKVIRSARRSFALEVRPEAVLVRVPLQATDEEIERFLAKHQKWLDNAVAKQEQQSKELAVLPKLTPEDIKALADRALTYIPERVKYFASQAGVTYGRITIRNQRSRWGSCSAKGDLSFNCLLMLTPPEVIDSVVVHELCHRRTMDHSKRFYAEVLRVYPDYWKWHGWLKEHGGSLLYRMGGRTT